MIKVLLVLKFYVSFSNLSILFIHLLLYNDGAQIFPYERERRDMERMRETYHYMLTYYGSVISTVS